MLLVFIYYIIYKFIFYRIVNECTNDIFVENLRKQKRSNSELSMSYLCNNSMLLIDRTLNSLDLP